MKNLITRKTAGLLVFLMSASMLLPLIAFAANGFGTVTHDLGTNKVTGRVYIDSSTYAALGGPGNVGNLNIEVRDKDGNVVSTGTYATYTTYGPSDGNYYYDLDWNAAGKSTSFPVTFRYYHPSNSTYAVSSPVQFDTTFGTGNGGPIGGGIGFPLPDTDFVIGEDGKISADDLKKVLTGDGIATIEIKGDNAVLPASGLLGGKSLTLVKADGTSITLPIEALKLNDLAKALGVSIADLTIRVEMKVVTSANGFAAAADAIGEAQSEAVDFKLTAVAGSKEQEIKDLGVYFNRTIALKAVADSDEVTVVLFNPTTKTFSFVPAVIVTKDGRTAAVFKRTGLSIYSVIKTDAKSFTDMAFHWAKNDVGTLAQKLVVEGTKANIFEPKRNITRAEFAAMIVRSLGLEATGTTSKFSDVAGGKWYAGVVAAATNAGIINGYENGTFRPNASISRKELAAMVVRAMKYAGKNTTLTEAEATAALKGYTDASSLAWARAEVAVAVKAGIVKGHTASQVAGNATANRAEAATMVFRFLTDAGFIN